MGQIDRIMQFIEYKKISKSMFERNCGLANGYINKVKGNIGEDKLQNILRVYPEINKTWLLAGEGDMIYNTYKINSTTNNGSISQGQTINIELPTSGTEKIIKPDGTVEIQQASQNSDNSGEIARLKQRIEDLERLIQSKDEIICLLKESVARKI